jgi:hypothetical protein
MFSAHNYLESLFRRVPQKSVFVIIDSSSIFKEKQRKRKAVLGPQCIVSTKGREGNAEMCLMGLYQESAKRDQMAQKAGVYDGRSKAEDGWY